MIGVLASIARWRFVLARGARPAAPRPTCSTGRPTSDRRRRRHRLRVRARPREAGVRVRLHEAREIAAGASGRNGGFALRGGAMAYDEARRARSAASGGRALAADGGVRSTASRRSPATRSGRGSLRLAADEAERDALRAEHEALREDGFAVEWLDDAAAASSTALPAAALRHPPDGALQPARWVRRLAARRRRRAPRSASTPRRRRSTSSRRATSWSRPTATRAGSSAELDAVDHADARPGDRRPSRSPSCSIPLPHYARHGFDYWHQTPDGRLVVGGRPRRRPRRRSTAEEAHDASDPGARSRPSSPSWSGARSAITHRWAGIFGLEPRRPAARRAGSRHDGSGSPSATRATATCSASRAATSSRARSWASADPSSTCSSPRAARSVAG